MTDYELKKLIDAPEQAGELSTLYSEIAMDFKTGPYDWQEPHARRDALLAVVQVISIRQAQRLDRSTAELTKVGIRVSKVGIGVAVVGVVLAAIQVWVSCVSIHK